MRQAAEHVEVCVPGDFRRRRALSNLARIVTTDLAGALLLREESTRADAASRRRVLATYLASYPLGIAFFLDIRERSGAYMTLR